MQERKEAITETQKEYKSYAPNSTSRVKAQKTMALYWMTLL